MTNPQRPSDDEPRSQPFQPMSYDLAPEYGTPPPANNPPHASNEPYGPTSGAPGYPVSPSYQQQPSPYGPPQSYPPSPYGSPQSGPPSPYGSPQSSPPSPYGSPQQGYPASAPGYSPTFPAAQPFPTAQPFPAAQPQQPGYPGQGGPIYTQPPKKGKGLKITLSVLGGLFLVCAIAACALFYPVYSQSGAHVTAPATLPGGLTKETSETFESVVDDMEADLKNDVGSVDEVAAGIYTSADAPDKIVVLVAATSTILFPETELDEAFSGFDEPGLTMGDPKTYDAGDLGGTLKCATGTSEDTTMTLCAWADHGSVGIGIFLDRGLAESASLFVQIRDAVQTR